MAEKRCRICGEIKSLDNFYRAAGMKDGHRGECRDCFQRERSERYYANPEVRQAAIERTRRYQTENEERYRAAKRAYQRTPAYKRALRKSHLKRMYGMTPDDYDRMLEEQGGGCAICGRPPREDISLHVDHDHETGRIRGLLCFVCNNGLGQFQDDPELLVRALDYLTATGTGPEQPQRRLF